MNTSDTFTITLKILGNIVPIKVARSQEEIYRRAAELINSTFDKYTKKYNKLSRDRIMALVALQLAVSSLINESNYTDVVNSIEALNVTLEEFLNNE